MSAICSEDAPPTCVEERVMLKGTDSGFNGVKGSPSDLQDLLVRE